MTTTVTPVNVPMAPAPATQTQGTSPSKATDTAAAASSAFGKLGPDAFLKLLVAQLKYQNPFNPSDPSAMLGQVAMFTQVEALNKLQAGQTSNQALEQARLAGDVIGKQVTGKDSLGAPASGIVSSARFTTTGPVLVLSTGKEMPLASVETISAASAPPAAPLSGSADASGTSNTSGTSKTSGTSGSSDTSGSSSGTSPTNARPLTGIASSPTTAPITASASPVVREARSSAPISSPISTIINPIATPNRPVAD